MTTTPEEPRDADSTATPPPVVPDESPPVEEQRAELARTVDALTDKLDVPTRLNAAASQKAHDCLLYTSDAADE